MPTLPLRKPIPEARVKKKVPSVARRTTPPRRTVTVRFTADDVGWLDRLRGKLTRSAYLAELVRADARLSGARDGALPMVRRQQAALTVNVTIPGALAPVVERRRGSGPRAGYLLALHRAFVTRAANGVRVAPLGLLDQYQPEPRQALLLREWLAAQPGLERHAIEVLDHAGHDQLLGELELDAVPSAVGVERRPGRPLALVGTERRVAEAMTRTPASVGWVLAVYVRAGSRRLFAVAWVR